MLVTGMAAAGVALADAPVFLLDATRLPFDLGPGAPQNSPTNPANLPSAAANSAASPANSSRVHANSGHNPANEKRVLFDVDGRVLGHYVQNAMGTMNLFDLRGRRVAYRPRQTASVFDARGEWCGTVAQAQDGGLAFGITRKCLKELFP